LIARNGKPIGTDFSNVQAAGRLTWQGRAAEAHEPALHCCCRGASPAFASAFLVLLVLYVFTSRRALLDRERVSVAVGRYGVAQA
jgi:hypothetical protein